MSSALAGVMPRFPHIVEVSPGHEVPENMRVLRMLEAFKRGLGEKGGGGEGEGERHGEMKWEGEGLEEKKRVP